jgi:hypothetical protein
MKTVILYSRKEIRVLMGIPVGNSRLGKRWKCNVKMALKKTGCENGRWMTVSTSRLWY